MGNPPTENRNTNPHVVYLHAHGPPTEHLREPDCRAECPGEGSQNVLYPREVYRYVEHPNKVDPHKPGLHEGRRHRLSPGVPGFQGPGLHVVGHCEEYRCEGRLGVLCHCEACLDKASPRAVDRSASSFCRSASSYLVYPRVESQCELPDLNVRYIFHHNPSDTCYAEQYRLILA